MSKPVYIVEEIKSCVDRTRVRYKKDLFYMYGHPLEIVNRLQVLSTSKTKQLQQFPLIALFTDIPLVVNTTGIYGTANLKLIIATSTKPEYSSEERLENTFKKILYPIQDIFLDEVYKHRQFTYELDLAYTTTDRFFWGKTGLYGNEGNMFNDYIDAIEISNLIVNIKNKC